MMHNELAPFWKMKKLTIQLAVWMLIYSKLRVIFPYLKDSTVQMLAIRGTRLNDAKDLRTDFDLTRRK